jgi:hypothetical protein
MTKAIAPTKENLKWDKTARFALYLMDRTSHPLFITGKAGTGKSTLLQYFRAKTKKNVAVLAPTGLAAINVQGQTVHSFFRFPSKTITEFDIRKLYGVKWLKKLDTIIIDEVSMVRADVMDGIDQSLRLNRRSKQPFGGVQMIFFGDLFQLPPIVRNDDEAWQEAGYETPYFFSAKVFQETHPALIELGHIHRQRDPHFIDILNAIREKNIGHHLLSALNQRAISITNEGDSHIILTTINDKARRINEERLSRLSTKLFTFDAGVRGEFEPKDFPTDEQLRLKAGAQVMFIKNDADKRWVNGSLGKVIRLSTDGAVVEVEGEMHEVEVETWDRVVYRFNEEEGKVQTKVLGTFQQLPLKLAYAITIHKSQGQTFDRAIIDLDQGAFAHGQTYVALSRCRALDGLVLSRPIRQRDVLFDTQVYQYKEVFPEAFKAHGYIIEQFQEARRLKKEGLPDDAIAFRTQLSISDIEQLSS